MVLLNSTAFNSTTIPST